MKLTPYFSHVVVATTLAVSSIAPAFAQEGVQVKDGLFDKISRSIVPSGKLEAQAALQYQQTLDTAAKARALGGDNHPQVKRLRAIANKLIPFATMWNKNAAEWKWEVNLIGSKQVNAYCMPGGKIVFYTGILDQLRLTDDEVAMIMGHEIAHALREHGQERAGTAMIANLGVKAAEIYAAYKGVDPNIAGAVGGGVAKMTLLKFSRGDESEADIIGLDLAARAGYDPRAGIALWTKMGMLNKSAPPPWLSTHPSGETRINDIRAHLPEVMPLYAKAKGIDPAAISAYKSNVKGMGDIP